MHFWRSGTAAGATRGGGEGMGELRTLEGMTTGRYVVTTASGTRHFLDLDGQVAVRIGAAGHEWGDEILVPDPYVAVGGEDPKFAAHYEPVTRDGAPMSFSRILNPTVGERMYLENSEEWRLTSVVMSIDPDPIEAVMTDLAEEHS